MKKVRKIISVILVAVMLAGIAAIAPVTAGAATPAWKTTYINYINKYKNEINNGGWGWIKDLDGNGVTELFISINVLGHTEVKTYYNGELRSVSASAYGKVYVQNDKFFLSWGRQGGYGDTVYRQNGASTIVFDGKFVAKNINFPEISDDYFVFRYRFNENSDYRTVTQAQYNNALNSAFNTSKAGVLNYNNCYHTASQIINAINNYVSPPVAPTVSLTNKSNGIYVGWNKVANASKYIVYFKKPSDTAWTQYTTSNNYFTLNSVISGQLYYVQVQGIASNGAKGGYSKVKSMTFIAQPKITSLIYNGNNTLNYSSVRGANKYQIARLKSGDKSYTYFTTTGTSFSEYATGGIAYTYQVRPMYVTQNSGTAYGAWSAGKSVVTLVAPTLTLSNQGKAVVAKWNSIRGAVKYNVYFKTASAKKWNTATSTGTSLSITGVVLGTTYYVQVRPIGSTVNGPYSSVKSIVYASTTKPVLTLSNAKNGIDTKWNYISGATAYIVYYKTASDTNFTSFKTAANFNEIIVGPCIEGERYYIQVQPEFNGQKGACSSVYSLVHHFVY